MATEEKGKDRDQRAEESGRRRLGQVMRGPDKEEGEMGGGGAG